MALNRRKGFPEYNHPDAVMTCDGRSAAELVASFFTAENTDVGAVYDAEHGWKRPYGRTGEDQVHLAAVDLVNANEGLATWWAEAKMFANATYDNESINRVITFLVTNGTNPHLRLGSGNNGSTGWGPAVGINQLAGDACGEMEGYIPHNDASDDNYIRIDMSVHYSDWQMYVNGLPFLRGKLTENECGAGRMNFLDGFRWGGNAASTASVTPDVFFKDFQLMAQAIDLKFDAVYRDFVWLSDSFGRYSAYSGQLNSHQLQGNIVDNYGGGLDLAITGSGISGGLAVVHGKLNLAGYSPRGGRIQNFSVGGARVGIGGDTTIDTLLQTVLHQGIVQSGTHAGVNMTNDNAGYGSPSPDVIFSQFGANNVTGASVLAYADMYDGFVNYFNGAVAAGVKRVIITDCMPTAVEGGVYADAQCEANILTYNQALDDAAALYANVFVCKIYDRLGGQANFHAEDYAGDRHPSQYGTYKVGTWVFETFMQSVGG